MKKPENDLFYKFSLILIVIDIPNHLPVGSSETKGKWIICQV